MIFPVLGKTTYCGIWGDPRGAGTHKGVDLCILNSMAKDLTNKRFGKLLVIQRSGTHMEPSGGRKATWLCRCDCGNTTIVQSTNFRATVSCGCHRRRALSHGHTVLGQRTSEYLSWQSMHQRCENPNSKNYYRYGGRGITVCKRWQKFDNFIKDMGSKPAHGLSIERKNNDKGYSPSNCTWATLHQQARNTRRTVWVCLPDGKRVPLAEAAEKLGISYAAAKARRRRGTLR
jgi:hypothetical protein